MDVTHVRCAFRTFSSFSFSDVDAFHVMCFRFLCFLFGLCFATEWQRRMTNAINTLYDMLVYRVFVSWICVILYATYTPWCLRVMRCINTACSATLHSLWKILLTIHIYKYIHLFIFLFTYEEILHQRHSTLEIAADVRLTNSQETQAPAEAQDITWLSLVSGVLRICARCSLETAPSFRTSKPHQLL